jgi:hypothetical protein
MQNITAVMINEIGNRCVESFAVGALHQQNGRISQGLSPRPGCILLESAYVTTN